MTPAPYGYTRAVGFTTTGIGPILRRHPGEQRAIARIVQLRTYGLSLESIAARLNAEGVRPRGRQWWAMTVKRILDRRG